MHAVRRPRQIGWPDKLAADKGYSCKSIRSFLQACKIKPTIPRKSNQPAPKDERFDKKTCRKRARVEQAVGRLKECRRRGTQYEKLGRNFPAFAKLGVILRYLRFLIRQTGLLTCTRTGAAETLPLMIPLSLEEESIGLPDRGEITRILCPPWIRPSGAGQQSSYSAGSFVLIEELHALPCAAQELRGRFNTSRWPFGRLEIRRPSVILNVLDSENDRFGGKTMLRGRPRVPIDYRIYGINRVTVAFIPSICDERLVVYSANIRNPNGWAIRDFITNRWLENEHSARTRASIETEIEANYSEYPPFYSVADLTHAARWEIYLVLRTIAYHRRNNAHYNMAFLAAPGDTWGPIVQTQPWMPLVL